MASRVERADSRAIFRQVLHPPVDEWRFWLIQLTVLVIAGVHLFADINLSNVSGAFPAGIPVAILIIPAGYAAFRYGLTGSAATAIWATLLWLPDLMLPHDQGHVGADVINLILIDVVAIVFGQRIEAERSARTRAEQATAQQRSAEAGYRQLFDANRAPIVVLDAHDQVLDANPAGDNLFGGVTRHVSIQELLKIPDPLALLNGRTLHLRDDKDYRIGIVALPAQIMGASTQLIFEDVTEELSESRRATQYARLVVKVEEEQRRNLARELHDEPLQLFLHLARRLETLGSTTGVPTSVSGGLEEARQQALDAATRLRMLARDLRPPALDQLGLAPALSSLLSDVEEETTLITEMKVTGTVRRLSPDVELGAFRIVQESVRNALRHADAYRLGITIDFGSNNLTLEVRDDGRGFTPRTDQHTSTNSMGILGMRERANILGGHLDVQSSPGRGTVISGSIPIGVHSSTLGARVDSSRESA